MNTINEKFASRWHAVRLFQLCFVFVLATGIEVLADDPAAPSATEEVRLASFGRITADGDEVPLRFHLPNLQVIARMSRPREFDEYTQSRVTFPSAVVTDHEVNNTVHCEYFQPKWTASDDRIPAVVVLHILGGDFELSRMCCRALSRGGVATLFLKMPYYGPRRPAGVRERMIGPDPEKTVARVTQAVKDIRRATDWLETRREVDAERLGITGISLGGIVASLSASVEPRFANCCFVLAGGDFATIFMESTEMDEARAAWKDVNVTPRQVGQALQPIDPLTYAARLQGRNVLMMNGTKDSVIPRVCTEQLWEIAGKPEIIWWNAGHHSAAIYLPSGLSRMLPHFKSPKSEQTAVER